MGGCVLPSYLTDFGKQSIDSRPSKPESVVCQDYSSRRLGKPGLRPIELVNFDGYVKTPSHERAAVSRRLLAAGQGMRSYRDMSSAVKQSLAYATRKPQWQSAVIVDGMSLTWEQMRQTLAHLLEVLPSLDGDPELLSRDFVWYNLSPRPMLTAYYTPEINASYQKGNGYIYPIYGVPSDLRKARSPEGYRYYRVENGRILPYHDRRAVDINGVLKGRGLEIAWAKDPIDVFYMQIEGAGRLRFPDGKVRDIVYAGRNGHKFKALSRIMYEKGYLPRHKLDKNSIKEYFRKRPQRMFALMAENRNYIFFRFSDCGAQGTFGGALTPLVSVASDPTVVPLGGVLVLDSVKSAKTQQVHGIVLAQDTGAAIRGAHLDYYVGEGAKAERLASRMKQSTGSYLLVSKNALR